MEHSVLLELFEIQTHILSPMTFFHSVLLSANETMFTTVNARFLSSFLFKVPICQNEKVHEKYAEVTVDLLSALN